VIGGCNAADTLLYESKAKHAVGEQLLDANSAAYRHVAVRGGQVCGEVNARNAMGAFVGFRRFVVKVSDWTAQIDPQFQYTDLVEADELCSPIRNNEYTSLASTVSACQRAEEKHLGLKEQQVFDAAWNGSCEGQPQLPYQPPLLDIDTKSSVPAAPVSAEVASDADAGDWAVVALGNAVSNDTPTDADNADFDGE
jgi:hypothetical protein